MCEPDGAATWWEKKTTSYALEISNSSKWFVMWSKCVSVVPHLGYDGVMSAQ